MRSELVFMANARVSNRFELCHLASRSARTLNRNAVSMHETINEVLTVIGDKKKPVAVVKISPVEIEASDVARAVAV